MISELDLSEFLQIFSPISLHHKKPEDDFYPWVFWNESEGCENNSSSADLATTPMFQDKIKSALSNTRHDWCFFLGQFWAPVTIDCRRLLSTSHQPFAVRYLSNDFAQYRLRSEMYKYNIDANKLHIEPNHMILSGGPAPAFFNCRTSINKLQGFPLELNNKLISFMRAGLDLFYVQHLIPYKAISGLEVAKDEIEEALKVVCQSHNLALAQV
ncbi:hypothetical protein Hanom_Chr02g00144781 [Helianthus anomalus]